jgi:lipopolysaccharide transport system permease protein
VKLTRILGEIYRYRVLIWSLVSRELRARYRGSTLGFLWTFLNPLLLMMIYVLVFSVFMRVQMENYAIFMFVGLLPWIFFSSALLQGTNAVVAGGSLITKVMFPPQVLPAVVVISNLMNYLFSLPVLMALFVFFGMKFSIHLVAFPVILLVQVAFTFALILPLSALNVRYRDINQLIGNILTLWFFLSPIIYPMSSVPESFRTVMKLNPMTVLMLAYQDIFFYNRWPDFTILGGLLAASVLVMIVGARIFEGMRDSFAEEV